MITEFRIGCSKTINLGNFQNIRVEATVTVALVDKDRSTHGNWKIAEEGAQEELRRLLEQTYKAQLRELK